MVSKCNVLFFFFNEEQSILSLIVILKDEYIIFMQVKSEQFVSQLDKENRDFKEEVIGDFRIVVSQNNHDTIFESVTETSAIFVQTNAGYDVGKKFIESLEEK